MSRMKSWAEKEVELACKREASDREAGEWDYVPADYECALRVFKCLLEDYNSGYSIGNTKQILNRLIDGKPLTPIEDTPDVWKEVSYLWGKRTYQCKRMDSLFKYVCDDGTVKYSDVDRVALIENGFSTLCRGGFDDRIIDEMFPITMPYYPSDQPFRIYSESFLADRTHYGYDTVGILYIIKPDGVLVEINRYFKHNGFIFEEIDEDEYSARKKESVKKG